MEEDYRILAKLKDCQLCGSDINKHVHHIKPRREGGTDEYNNLTVLCNLCHEMFHADKRFFNEKSELVKSKIVRTPKGTFSYKGNKWGRKSLVNETKEKILYLHNKGLSQRNIKKELLDTWDKEVSLGSVNKTIKNK